MLALAVEGLELTLSPGLYIFEVCSREVDFVCSERQSIAVWDVFLQIHRTDQLRGQL